MALERKTDSNEDELVVNITYQLKGAEAEQFIAYMEREFIKINSVAAQKLALERLSQLVTVNA